MSLAQRLFGDGRFCCVAHRRRFREETERAALEVLQRFREGEPQAGSSDLLRKVRTEAGPEPPTADWLAGTPPDLVGAVRAERAPAGPEAEVCPPCGSTPLPPKAPAALSPSVSRSWPPARTTPRAGDALARMSALAACDCLLPRVLPPEPVGVRAPGTVVAPEEFHDPLFRKAHPGARLTAAPGLCPVGGVGSLPARGALRGMPPFRRAETGAVEVPDAGAILVPEEFDSPGPRAMARDLWRDVPAGSGSADGPASIPARARFSGQSPFPRAGTATAMALCPAAAAPRTSGCTPVAPALDPKMTAPGTLAEPPAAQEPRWILSRPRPLPPEMPALLVAAPSSSSAVSVPTAGVVEPGTVPAAPPEAAGLLCTLSIFCWSPGPTTGLHPPGPLPDFAPPRAACLALAEGGPLAMPVPRRKIRSGPALAAPGEMVPPRFESGPAASSLSPARSLPAGARVESERESAPPGLAWLAAGLEIAGWREAQEEEAQPEPAEDEFHVTMKLARPRLIRETPEIESLSERLWRVYVPRFQSPTLRPRLSAGPRPAAAFGY